jgi:hypothetical protein
MADQFDLEQEVARLRGKLRSLTIITVLFMLAVGALAGVVLAKVSKKPAAPPPVREIVLQSEQPGGPITTLKPGEIVVGSADGTAQVRPTHLLISKGATDPKGGSASTVTTGGLTVKDEQGQAELTGSHLQLRAGDQQFTLDAPTGVKLLEPPPAPVPAAAPPEPEPEPAKAKAKAQAKAKAKAQPKEPPKAPPKDPPPDPQPQPVPPQNP